MNAIQTRALRRVFTAGRDKRGKSGSRTALDGVDLSIPPGEVHGLLGPNGAGKTTLCKILSTVLVPTSGSASVMGHDVVTGLAAVRPLVGCVFGGDRGLYGRLSGRKNLAYWAALYGVPRRLIDGRTTTLLDRFGLAGRADERVETYSRGMKQRLHLARGLVHNPPVLLLDEPTTGMDPVSAMDFRRLIGELRNEGRTVLVTTHDMAEAEAVCDRVTLVNDGRILHSASPQELSALVSRYGRVEARNVPDTLTQRVRILPGVTRVATDTDGVTRIELASADAAPPVLRLLIERGVTDLATCRPGLEEVYLHLIADRGMEVGR
ncbi:ABC transporter ATP-binding protein [Streptomyces cavernae]|uniref:ABC transporter ATP-binding protein n=1 Tax=Streptomyces cavernae TaxID=2259034 RepID=UPI000FEBF99C|nr:ABC transporter ATP-binding protein [Streptomyces cavernae]